MKSDDSHYRRDVHFLAILAVATAWPLLLSGGQVTTYRVGMAVPDWPTTFGINMFLFDFLQSPWGVYIEHRHRLLGAMIGLELIVLAVWIASRERRVGVKILGFAALAGVIFQGLLGGLRVRLNSTLLASVHGVSAQLLFGLLVVLAVATSREWMTPAASKTPDRVRLRWLSLGLVCLFVCQVVAGATLRHFGVGVEWHVGVGISAALFAIALASVIELRKVDYPALVKPVRLLELALLTQLVLGVSAWWMLRPFDGIARPVTAVQALIRTGHQGTGAIVLGCSVALALACWKNLNAVVEGNEVESVAHAAHQGLEAVL